MIDFNTNLDALTALYNINNINSQITTANQRLSSGKRINSAADDPTGFVVSNALQYQVDGINQAVQNTQSAINLVKTATGALAQVTTLISAIRSAAQDAVANLTADPAKAQADQQIITNAITSINNIANTTQYGGKFLLNGAAGVTASVLDTTRVVGINLISGASGVASGAVTLTVTTAATQATLTGTVTYASASSLISSGGATTGGTINVNGQNIAVSGGDTVQNLLGKINLISGSTGVTANFTGGKIVLTQDTFGANFSVNLASSAAIIGAAGTLTASGINAQVNLTANTTGGPVTTTFYGGYHTTDSGLTLTSASGDTVTLTAAGNVAAFSGVVGVTTANPDTFQIGPNVGDTVSQSLPNVTTANLATTSFPGASLANIDVTTAAGANNAVILAKEAFNQIAQYSAQLGSFQTNVLQSNSNTLQITAQNLTASIATITDADIAAETTKLTQLQTIQQAGISVLRSAISTPSLYLKLLS